MKETKEKPTKQAGVSFRLKPATHRIATEAAKKRKLTLSEFIDAAVRNRIEAQW